MSSSHVIDAHAIIWFLQDDPRLGAAARVVLESTDSRLILPSICLAEACLAVERGRTQIDSVDLLLHAVRDDPRIKVTSINRAIVERAIQLTQFDDLHDRFIVATTLLLDSTDRPSFLLTADAVISGSELVKIVW